MKPLHRLALDWAIRSFGAEHVSNLPIRSLRLAEESVELAQAYGVPRDKMLDLVNIVYDRPRGDPIQEIGGVMMTITVLCAANGIDPDDAFVIELRRVLEKPSAHFAQRNLDKVQLGLTA
jgi:hypothetical protein